MSVYMPDVTMTRAQSKRFEVAVDGRVVRLGSVQHRLVSIMLMRRVPLSVGELIELMWPDPDVEPEWSMGYLRVMIHRIRTAGVPICNRNRVGYWI